MAPAYPDGCKVEVDESETCGQDDVVIVWFRPEVLKPGGAPAMIKRIVMMPAPWVTSYPYKGNPKSDVRAVIMLGRDDKPDEMFQVLCADILAIHKVVGILEDERCYDARPREDRQRVSRRRVR